MEPEKKQKSVGTFNEKLCILASQGAPKLWEIKIKGQEKIPDFDEKTIFI